MPRPASSWNLVWYPSSRIFSEKGILIGGYSIEFGAASGEAASLVNSDRTYRSPAKNGVTFGQLPNLQAKLDASRRSIELLHPAHGKNLANPIYISWGRIPYNLGSWISLDWNNQRSLATLQSPDRRM